MSWSAKRLLSERITLSPRAAWRQRRRCCEEAGTRLHFAPAWQHWAEPCHATAMPARQVALGPRSPCHSNLLCVVSRPQSAAAHRLHPEESEVAELVYSRVAAEAGGDEADAAAEAVIEVRALVDKGAGFCSTSPSWWAVWQTAAIWACSSITVNAAQSNLPFTAAAGCGGARGSPAAREAPSHC